MGEPGTYITPIEKDKKHLDILDGIKAVSLNCNGLGDHEKRSRCRVALKSFDVRLLQETHATTKTEFSFEKLLGGSKYVWSHGESNKRGVAIALGNAWEDFSEKEVVEGGRLVAGISSKNKGKTKFGFISVYAPNYAESARAITEYEDSLPRRTGVYGK